MKLLTILILGILLTANISCERNPSTDAKVEYARPFPIVAISPSASAAQKAAAQKLAGVLGLSGISEMKFNPVCCVWLEVTGWPPNPGTPGYVIINQPGGSVINASDETQLQAAVDRLVASIHKTGNEVQIPLGIMTNYRVVPADVR